ncbi:DUF4394 domain-containing protein [Pseudotabrizicola formosa]|uniref:DUF4394 domain-containing protein n=1 Tax=Pseudotabrizicola formosa TaxID=2030009 RepID=UPI000CD2020D|nr:DUF4394 domain-containing protein [Pseudotabrizicola formosa]
MTLRSLFVATTFLVGVAGASSAATFGINEIALSLQDEGKSLVVLAGANAGSSVALKDPEGKSVRIDDIDFRPATGELYGYSDQDDTVYVINRMTGVATPVVMVKGITGSANAGIDFNNAIDKARVVTDGPGKTNENVVFSPGPVSFGPDGTPSLVSSDTTPTISELAYAKGDKNEKKNPGVQMNAYTNAFDQSGLAISDRSSIQFVIDDSLDVLATLANNTGILTTIGALWFEGKAFDASGFGGFDILSLVPGMNRALALLTTGFGDSKKNPFNQSIYEFDLTADAMGRVNLTRVLDVTQGKGQSLRLDGFAVYSAAVDTPAAVPLPASVLLLGSAVAGMGLIARRRRAKA